MLLLPLVFAGMMLNFAAKHGKSVSIGGALMLGVVASLSPLFASVMGTIAVKTAGIQLSELQNASLSQIDMIAYANAIFPVSEFVHIFGVYVTAWVILISIRWLKSFVPTIAN